MKQQEKVQVLKNCHGIRKGHVRSKHKELQKKTKLFRTQEKQTMGIHDYKKVLQIHIMGTGEARNPTI